jgi:hypothetical protein
MKFREPQIFIVSSLCFLNKIDFRETEREAPDFQEILTNFNTSAPFYNFDVEPFRPVYLESRKRKPAKTRKKRLKY